MIMDTNLVFSSTSTPQAVAGAAGDVVSTNIVDLAPHLAASVFYAPDTGAGATDDSVLVVTCPVAMATTTNGTFQVVLQSSTNATFDTVEKPQEFPLTGPLSNSVIVGTIAVTTGILNVTTLTSGTVLVGSLVTGGTTPAGTFVTAQLTGTAGGVGTYQTNCFIAVAAPTGTASVFAGKQFLMRLPFGLKRYLRVAYRTANQTTTGVTASAYIVSDPQQPVSSYPAMSGFTVG